MNLHEYQAKQLFDEYGLPVSKGIAVDTTEEALAAAREIGGERWVIKAQVHAGGRVKPAALSWFQPKTKFERSANSTSVRIW